MFFLPKKENKRCESNTDNSNPTGFELHKPSIKGTKLLFEIKKAIIIMRPNLGTLERKFWVIQAPLQVYSQTYVTQRKRLVLVWVHKQYTSL